MIFGKTLQTEWNKLYDRLISIMVGDYNVYLYSDGKFMCGKGKTTLVKKNGMLVSKEKVEITIKRDGMLDYVLFKNGNKSFRLYQNGDLLGISPHLLAGSMVTIDSICIQKPSLGYN